GNVLLDSNELPVEDWFSNGDIRVIDQGSTSDRDPFLEFTFSEVAQYRIEVFSVKNFDPGVVALFEFFGQSLEQEVLDYVHPDLSYNLIVQLQRHETNPDAIELVGKILTIVEGTGAGQTADTIVEGTGAGQTAEIIGYDAEIRRYTLKLDDIAEWVVPDTTSKFEIALVVADEFDGLDGRPNYAENPLLTDTYDIVLTAPPAAGKTVTVDITPAPTRTFNADDVFNPDTNFGQNEEVQVRAATTQVLVELTSDSPDDEVIEGDVWVITLTAADDPTSTETLLKDYLADPDDKNESEWAALGLFFYEVQPADTLLSEVATELAKNINDAGIGFTATPSGDTLLITSATNFFTRLAVDADTRGGATFTETQVDDELVIDVELTGAASMGEIWTLILDGVNVFSYEVLFRDDLATVTTALKDKVLETHAEIYDVIGRGREMSINRKDGSDFTVTVAIDPDSPGGAVITPQLEFTDSNWNVRQTVTVMAINDDFIDGGDALVFPAFEERVNAIRGPLTLEGNVLVGQERFLNDPFRLPEETNFPQADGTITSVGTSDGVDSFGNDSFGNATLTDLEASHVNALYGERPGFDPRMNDFLFAFIMLDDPAFGITLDVQSVSGEILSINDDTPFPIDLTISEVGDLATRVKFSGIPDQTFAEDSGPPEKMLLTVAGPTSGSDALEWIEAVLALTGTPTNGELWKLELTDSNSTDRETFVVNVTDENRALSTVARSLAAAVNHEPVGTAKVIDAITRQVGGTFFTDAIIELGGVVHTGQIWTLTIGDETQSYTALADDTHEDVAIALDALFGTATVTAVGTTIEISNFNGNSTSFAVRISAAAPNVAPLFEAESFVDILGDSKLRIRTADQSFPLFTLGFEIVLGPAEATTLGVATLGGTPDQTRFDLFEWTQAAFTAIAPIVVGEIWTITVDEVVDTYTVESGDTIRDVNQALADEISSDFIPVVSGNTVTFVSPWPNADQTEKTATTVTLTGTPVEAEIWSVELTVDDVTIRHDHTVGASETKAEVARALADEINTGIPGDFDTIVEGDAVGFITEGIGTTTVQLIGTPGIAEVWSVTLDDGVVPKTTHSYTTIGGETLTDIAAALAAAINEDAPEGFSATSVANALIIVRRVATDFTATTDGDTLLIVNREGDTFTTVFLIDDAPTGFSQDLNPVIEPDVEDDYFFTPVNPNIRVDEATQVDTLNVFHGNSPANDTAVLTDSTLTGLGMGGDAVIAGRVFAGGITYFSLEVINIELGTGNDHFTIESTHLGVTNLSTGAGNDVVDVLTISGHTTIEAGEGADTINVGSVDMLLDPITALLTIDGGAGDDTINADDSGEPDDNVGVLTQTTLTGLDMPTVSEVQSIFIQAASGTFKLRIADDGVDAATATTTLVELGLVPGGETVANEVWTVLLTVDDTTYSFSHDVAVGGGQATLTTIAAALAAAINGVGTDADFTAAAEDNVLIVVSRAGADFTAAVEIEPAIAGTFIDGLAAIDDGTGATTLATFKGAAEVGEVRRLTIEIDGSTLVYEHVVAGGETLADVAAALALALTVDTTAAALDFTAASAGQTLVLINRIGAAFATTIGRGSAPGSTIDDATATTVTVELSGTPAVTEQWTISLDGGASIHTVTIEGTPTLAEVAAALAEDINLNAPADFAATAEGDTVVIVNLAGAFTAALADDAVAGTVDDSNPIVTTIELVGAPVAGDQWSVTLDDTSTATTHTVVVPAGATLADVAAALADDINANADGEFTALTEGDVLIVVNRAGTVFTTSFDTTAVDEYLTRGDGFALVTVDYDTPADALQARLKTLYDFDGIRVFKQAINDPGTLTYTVAFVRDQAGIDFAEIEWGEEREETGLVPNRDASVDVKIATLRDGTTDPQLNNVQTVGVTATGGTFTLSFLLEDEEGEPAEFVSDPVAFDATALDLFKAISPLLNPTGASRDIDPDFDLETRNPALPFTDNVLVAKFDSVFHITFQGAHRDLLILDIDTALLTGAARSAVATIGVAPVKDQVFSLTLNDGTPQTFLVTAGDSDTEETIAAALADEINTFGIPAYAASSDGADLIIENIAGNPFTLSWLNTAPVVSAAAAMTTIELSGNPVEDEEWEVELDDGVDPLSTHTVTVTDGDSLADVAAALADDINLTAGANFRAAADGTTLVIVHLLNAAFATTFDVTNAPLVTGTPDDGATATSVAIQLTGTPVEDDDWTVTLDVGGTSHTVTVA
ncbi:MAG: beta strand repeat-containing protein, partial [Planctomycetota bacterium]